MEIDSILDERTFSMWRKFVEDYFSDGHKRDERTLTLDFLGDASVNLGGVLAMAYYEFAKRHPVNIVIQYMLEDGSLCKENHNGTILYYKPSTVKEGA